MVHHPAELAVVSCLILLVCLAGCTALPEVKLFSGSTSPGSSQNSTPASPQETSYMNIETIAPPDLTPMTPESPPAGSYQPLMVITDGMDQIRYRQINFSYRATVYPINIPVNPSIYRAAVSSGNKHLRLGNDTALELYNKILTDPAMEPVYADILRELRNARYKGGYKAAIR